MIGEPPLRITAEEFQARAQAEADKKAAARDHKFNAQRCEHDRRKFPSKKEGNRYLNLKTLQRSGHIRNLVCQKRYRLEVNGIKIYDYVADFVYEEKERDGTWRPVVEDTKGFQTEEFKGKRRLMKALFGIDVLLT